MISLSSPKVLGKEKEYINECLQSGWISTSGPFIEKFENELSKYVGAEHVVCCINGTAALQISLKLMGVKENDEVIVPTLTFIATINAVFYNNASPIFMDCDEYYNLDTNKTINFIKNETYFENGFSYNKKSNKKVAAIVPVHVWGNAVWFDELYELCSERNIQILEDASESLGTKYTKGKFKNFHTGTIGKIGCISFNANKVITAGGGGAIITNDKNIADKALYLVSQAKDDPIRYIHNEVGYNYRITNINAAIGLAQLEMVDEVLKRKEEIRNFYFNHISSINGLELARVPLYAKNNYWLNLITLSHDYKYNLSELFNKFDNNKIQTRPVWQLNHLQNQYKQYQKFNIMNAEKKIKNSLCIPSSSHLTVNQMESVVNILKN
tara:strand:- start:943 stop:2091 length:1149 start_codon:yes stop_codon:yes gene_type:complete